MFCRAGALSVVTLACVICIFAESNGAEEKVKPRVRLEPRTAAKKHSSPEDGPVSLGLVFDSSGSMKGRLDSSVEALKQFFLTAIPGDEFFVVQFADEAHSLGGFTESPEEIYSRLGTVQARGWTALLDAVALSTHRRGTAA